MVKTLFSLTLARTYLIFQLITRLALCIYAFWHNEIVLSDLPSIFLIGIINDLISCCYFLPVILIIVIILNKLLIRHKILHSILVYTSYFLLIITLLSISIAEIVFWDEFGTRFNFIAVDYLIYTNEIIGTIKESLPYVEILYVIAAIAILITIALRKHLINQAQHITAKQYIIVAIALFLCSLASFNFYNSNRFHLSNNKYAVELGKNGIYEFFSAYYNNSLDYNSFYPTIDQARALATVRKHLQQDKQQFIKDGTIERQIIAKNSDRKKYNVIFIVVESLSSEFMGKFGNTQDITPYLDKLAEESIFFTSIYAAGTRTVRGLEAITLSTPPTPGSSIIRRPKNNSLFNIGTIFRTNGYDIDFIFGGYSYFDNLLKFFSGNHYNVIDRSSLKPEEISFANIWGVADEDILTKSLKVADEHHRSGHLFYSLIMTTSNHRPYTFPEGRIDLPSGRGRAAAVKYTDYAIGKFLEAARQRPWFDDTIFVISSDHCASSAGKTDLPVSKYHIPLMIYAPKIFKPRYVKTLASQIDIGPTILGLLDFSYTSKFFGQDILNNPPHRAFISTYQLLGLIKNNHLVILSPKEKPKTYKLIGNEKEETTNIPSLTAEAISFYQIAYDFYIQGKMKE